MAGTPDARAADAHLIPGVPFCVPVGDLSHFYAFWIPILCFEMLLCGLALIRGYRWWRDNEIEIRRRKRRTQNAAAVTSNRSSAWNAPDAASSSFNILEILLRDSVGYFIVYVTFEIPHWDQSKLSN